MANKIQFRDSVDNTSLGDAEQDNIPRTGETVLIDNVKYSVEKIAWVYSDPRGTYPNDPLTGKAVIVYLNFIVGYPKKAKNVFRELSLNQRPKEAKE